jgi:hypothetical protein
MDYKHYGDARIATINEFNKQVLRGVDPALVASDLQGAAYFWLTQTTDGKIVDEETRGALLLILD